jgi:7-cyano-7-deazaguanine synthase
MARELAIVLANGSIQSAVTCALAAQKHRIVMVFADTGTGAGRPGQAFDSLVSHFKPYRSYRVPMPFLATVAKNDTRAAQADPRSSENVVGMLVELMPVVATGLRFAMHHAAAALYMGVRVGAESKDLARVTEFGQLWTEMVQVTCDRPQLAVAMPLLELDPWQVVDLGAQTNAPLQLTWSCENLAGDPCGECRDCRLREQAFQRAGRPDPAKLPLRTA